MQLVGRRRTTQLCIRGLRCANCQVTTELLPWHGNSNSVSRRRFSLRWRKIAPRGRCKNDVGQLVGNFDPPPCQKFNELPFLWSDFGYPHSPSSRTSYVNAPLTQRVCLCADTVVKVGQRWRESNERKRISKRRAQGYVPHYLLLGRNGSETHRKLRNVW